MRVAFQVVALYLTSFPILCKTQMNPQKRFVSFALEVDSLGEEQFSTKYAANYEPIHSLGLKQAVRAYDNV